MKTSVLIRSERLELLIKSSLTNKALRKSRRDSQLGKTMVPFASNRLQARINHCSFPSLTARATSRWSRVSMVEKIVDWVHWKISNDVTTSSPIKCRVVLHSPTIESLFHTKTVQSTRLSMVVRPVCQLSVHLKARFFPRSLERLVSKIVAIKVRNLKMPAPPRDPRNGCSW